MTVEVRSPVASVCAIASRTLDETGIESSSGCTDTFRVTISNGQVTKLITSTGKTLDRFSHAQKTVRLKCFWLQRIIQDASNQLGLRIAKQSACGHDTGS